MGATEKPTLLKWGTGKNFLTSTSDSSSSMFGSISNPEPKVDESVKEEKPKDDAEKKEEENEKIEETKEKAEEKEQDIVFQVYCFLPVLNVQSKVSVFELEGKEYKSRGKGLLKIIRFTISLLLLLSTKQTNKKRFSFLTNTKIKTSSTSL